MITHDLHMHTTFCDGKNTPDQMVISALNKGFKTIGFSGHSYTDFDESYCISKEDMKNYFDEIHRLKLLYKDRINILCGIEQDYYAGKPDLDFDYIIGSVHYILKNGVYLYVDKSEQYTVDAVNKYYNGDFYAYAEEYYQIVSDVLNKTNADIIGHFDLVTKFNEGQKLFDEKNPRYVNAYKSAVDSLITHNKPFEINTGAISRGYRTTPYPSFQILDYIKEKGGKVVFSSDSHRSDNIGFQFDKWEPIIKKTGVEIQYI